MRISKMARTALTVAAAALLPTIAAAPAQADIPDKGDTFVISTFFEGKILCATTRQDPIGTPVHPLVPCSTNAPEQQWKRTDSGRFFQNVASGICLDNRYRKKKECDFTSSGPSVWQQDALGRVWKPGGNSITKTFWAPIRHLTYGPMIGWSRRSNGTLPDDAAPFHLGVVKRGDAADAGQP
ncbi:RICIN domain-containing protein [Streptomyces sp. 15-116A]|uniref:RICIN domain-containing protein n=1 Tax=Streptomyces sp. 15-116A TaxID=2259035 RepID=UPI0021B1ED76|nr:RICIN domain-containing protein [Streptomyces sp. 15-116A]